MRPAGLLEILWKDDHGVVVLWRRSFVVQVRRGELTPALFARVRKPTLELAAAGAPMGALLVVEPRAPIASEEVRQDQKSFINDLAAHPEVRVAPVLLGDDVQSTLQRSVGRLVAAGNPRVQRFPSVLAGATWLSTELSPLGLDVLPSALVTMVQHLRELGWPKG